MKNPDATQKPVTANQGETQNGEKDGATKAVPVQTKSPLARNHKGK